MERSPTPRRSVRAAPDPASTPTPANRPPIPPVRMTWTGIRPGRGPDAAVQVWGVTEEGVMTRSDRMRRPETRRLALGYLTLGALLSGCGQSAAGETTAGGGPLGRLTVAG